MDVSSFALRRALCVVAGFFAGVSGALAAAPEFNQVVEPVAETAKGPPSPLRVSAQNNPAYSFDVALPSEVEPNDASGTATPLAGTSGRIQGNVFANGDVDFFSFTANAGDRLYAATMTSFSANGSSDSVLDVLDTDGSTVLETDQDDGTFGALSSSIAGRTLPANGTYFLRVRHFSATNQLRPYMLYYRLQSGAPTPETEPNDAPGTANVLPAGGWVSGARNPALATEQDWFSFSANAGDTVFLSLDLDPERDNVQWNGRLGIALFGDADNQILVANDGSTGSAANPLSEAMFLTIKNPGTYFAFVDSATAAVGGPTATYHLSVTVLPAPVRAGACTTYTSTDVPQVIPTGPGMVSSTITVPGNPRIEDLNVSIQLNHSFMPDLDVHLRSPSGNDNGLFTDIGANTQLQMDLTLDDEAGIPFVFTAVRPLVVQPENAYRLDWFDGEDAGGVWTLDIRDDATGDGGNLTGWSMTICEPPPPPTCAAGFTEQVVYSTDFESGAAGFTHSGAADEWELGLPATALASGIAPFTTCNSGTNCWKTDLDGNYENSSSQDLLSPNIDLSGLQPPVMVRWAQRYQMESASFDHYSVDIRQAGGAGPLRLFEWLGATMSNSVGNPTVVVGESAGWSQMAMRADAFAGMNTELLFHLDGDTTVSFAGAAIDDVSVTACRALSADLAITKTDGVASAIPGTTTTYTITASNAGPDADPAATVADTFPAGCASVNWTCVGAGGGTCTGSGSGNINQTVGLPLGGSVTYTAQCAIGAAATGSLSNTATVTATVTDPNGANNSATDTDTLTPQGDLSITKTDGTATVAVGGSLTYTIVASNAGPSNAVAATVADTFPAELTCTWTCSGAGGGTCPASGSGNISSAVNLPAGGSTTFTANCAVSGALLGGAVINNTATVTAPGGFTDTNGANNSATDTTTTVTSLAISATKAVAPTGAGYVPGGGAVYTIVLNNAGPGAQADNPGDEFFDPLPAGVSFSSVGATSGAAAYDPVTRTVTWNGALAAAASVTITINVTINPGANNVFNQGTVNFDADGNGTNESSALTDNPAAAGPADPTGFQVAFSIPANATWALLLLAGLMLVVVWQVRQTDPQR